MKAVILGEGLNEIICSLSEKESNESYYFLFEIHRLYCELLSSKVSLFNNGKRNKFKTIFKRIRIYNELGKFNLNYNRYNYEGVRKDGQNSYNLWNI